MNKKSGLRVRQYTNNYTPVNTDDLNRLEFATVRNYYDLAHRKARR